MNQILKSGVRILKQSEYKEIREVIKNMEQQLILDTAMLTGIRWVELRRFSAHSEWYAPHGEYIFLPREASRKKKEH